MPLSTDSVYVVDPIKDPEQLVTKKYVDDLIKKSNQPTKTIIKKEVIIVDKHTQMISEALKSRSERNTSQTSKCASGWSKQKCAFHYDLSGSKIK